MIEGILEMEDGGMGNMGGLERVEGSWCCGRWSRKEFCAEEIWPEISMTRSEVWAGRVC